MTTKQDIELRITANDLGTKKLEELAVAIEELRRSQEAYAASGDAASKSLRELTTELADLRRIGQELSGRGALVDLFDKTATESAEAAKRVDESRAALDRYKASLAGTENVTRKQQTELAKLEKGFASASKRFADSSKALEKIRADLAKLGLDDTGKARAALVGMADQVSAALTRSEQAVRSYDAAMRQKREADLKAAEAARKLASEEAKKAAQATRDGAVRRQALDAARSALETIRAARNAEQAARTLAPAADQVARSLRAIADPAREATRQIDTLEKALSDLEADLRAASGGDATAADNIRRQRTEYAAFARDATKAALAVAETIDAYRRQSTALDQTRASLEGARNRTNALSAEIIKAGVPTDELRRKLSIARTELAGLTAQFARESASVAQLGARLREAGVDATRLEESEKRLTTVTTRLAAAQTALGTGTVRLGQANKQAAASFLDVADKGRKALTVYQRIRGQVFAMTSAYVGLFGVLRFAQTSIQAVGDRQAVMTGLLVASGNDTRLAAQDFAFVRQKADEYGLVLDSLAKQYAKLAIAARSYGISNNELRETFSGFAQTIRAFNLSEDEAAGVFKALEQVFSKAKVAAEELRNQLGDRLPAAVTMFAKSLGISTVELSKRLEAGVISADALVNFAKEYADLTREAASSASQQLPAQLNRLKNAIVDFKIAVANAGLADIVRDLATSLTAFLKSTQGQETARQIAEGFRAIGNALLFVIQNLETLRGAFVFLFGGLAARFILNQVAELSKLVVAYRALSAAATGASAAIGRVGIVARGSLPLIALSVLIGTLVKLYIDWKTKSNDLEEAQLELQKSIDAVSAATDEQREKALFQLRVQRRLRLEMLQTAEAALARARAEMEINAALDARSPVGEPGERASRAGRAVGQNSRITALEARIKELNKQIAQANQAITEAENYVPPDPNARTTETEDPVVDTEALKRLQDERVRLEQEAVEAIIEARKGLLQADEDNLEAQLELIDIEFGERVLRIRELQEALRGVGLGGVAEALEPIIETYTAVRGIQRAEAERNAELAARKTLQDELNAKEEALNRLIEARDARIDLINAKREIGVLTDRQAQDEIARVQLESQGAILARVQELRDFILNNQADLAEFLNIDEVLAGLEKIQLETQYVDTNVTKMVAEMRENIAGGLTESIVAFGTAIGDVIKGTGSLSDAFKSARDAFLNFAADFLLQIAKMIIQQQILRALQSIGGLSGVLGSIAGMAAHTGGVVGHGGGTPRSIPAWMVATAPRYHSGTVLGLRADERPAILQAGEEVLARNDPRNALNGGGSRQPVQVKVVNTIDRDALARDVLSTPTAVSTIANVIRANKAAFKAALA
jgi:tape measure domain-containing protein